MDFKGSVGYLIHEIAQQLTTEADRVLFDRFGIGFSQYKVLMCVESAQGAVQKEIAASLSQTEASISRQIGLLIDANLVEIGPSKDSRRHVIYLTPRGETMVVKASEVLNGAMANYFIGLTPHQLSELHEALFTVKNRL